MSYQVGVDHGGAEFRELIRNQRLAAADAAGQADGKFVKCLGWFHYYFNLLRVFIVELVG
jgi:hypothetical protein